MTVVPAGGLGLLVVALAIAAIGYLLTSFVLNQINKRRFNTPAYYRGYGPKMLRPGEWSDEAIEKASRIGAIVFALVVLPVSLFLLPKEWLNPLLFVLAIIGVITGILTFVLRARPSRENSEPSVPPASSTRVPPRRARSTGQTKSGAVPPRQNARPPDSKSNPVPPQVKQDPYRNLLAKAQYNKSLADKLVEEERQYMPSATFDDLCNSAIARLEQGAK